MREPNETRSHTPEDEIKAARARIDKLEVLLGYAREALFWHDGDNFEPSDSNIAAIGPAIDKYFAEERA